MIAVSRGPRGYRFVYVAALIGALLVAMQPRTKSAWFTNLARIFEVRASERPLRRLKMNANRAAALVVSQHLEAEIFTPSERRSLAGALRFARLSEAAWPDSRTALATARLQALLGDQADALKELDRRPSADLAGPWAVLSAALNDRLGTHAARDDWSIGGDTSAAYFLDLSQYLSQRRDLEAADESLRRAIDYARSPSVRYVANYRMALHKMYGLDQAEASLTYFSHADSLRALVPSDLEDAFGFHFSYAHALLNARRFSAAVVQAGLADDLNSRDPRAQDVLGRAYLDSGNLLLAKRAYTASINRYEASNQPVSGYTYFGMGQTAFALGDADQAREMFQRALEAGVPDELRRHITGLLPNLAKPHDR